MRSRTGRTSAMAARPGGTAGPRSYLALSASGSVDLVGVDGLTLSGSLAIEVNSAKNGSATANAVDFTQLTGHKLPIPVAPGETPPSIDLAYSGTLLKATGMLTLGIDGFAFVTGTFGFEQGETNLPQRGLDVVFRQADFAAQRLEGVLNAGAERLEHDDGATDAYDPKPNVGKRLS